MPKIKINCKPLVGIEKEVEVKPTYGLMMLAQKMEIEGREVGELNPDNFEDQKKVLQTAQDITKFIQKILELSDAEIDKFIYSADPKRIGDILGYISMRLQGMSDEDFKAAQRKANLQQKAMKKDPKGSKRKTKKH